MSEVAGAGSVDWQDRPALSETDLADFLALQRVCGHPDSGVLRMGEQFVENQRPMLPFLADGVAALIEAGHAVLTDSSADLRGMRRVVVTASGRARYEDLCDRQGIAPYPVLVSDRTPGR